jgi:hypothetical protein
MSFFDVIIKSNNNFSSKSIFNINTIHENVDLRNKMSPLDSYEFLGSIANSLAILIEYDIPNYQVSRLFQYYIERLDIDDYVLENAINKLINYGFCSINDYPYQQHLINEKPPQEIYDKASLNKYKFDIIKISKDLNSLLLSINNNEPFIICIHIYEPIENIGTSLKLPQPNTQSLGAIAVIVCGYDMNKQIFIIRFLNKYIDIPFTYLIKEGLSSNAYIFVIRSFDIKIEYKQISTDVIYNENNDIYPDIIDLRDKFMEIYDQGKIGSCSANALCSIFEYDAIHFKGSRLFLYYNERLMINKTDEDSGAYLIDGINSLKKYGICEEKYWKYNIDNIFMVPSKEAYENAKNNYLIDSLNIKKNLNEIKKWLSRNEPIAIAIAIYSNFMEEGRNNGIINMPKETDIYLGGHAVILCGYIDKEKRFILRNSWGDYWGDKGYFYLPYEYIIGNNNLSGNDFWIITKSKIN